MVQVEWRRKFNLCPLNTKRSTTESIHRVIRKTNFNIKVAEKLGTKLKDILHKKDPFRIDTCGREDCFVCTSGGKGSLIVTKRTLITK